MEFGQIVETVVRIRAYVVYGVEIDNGSGGGDNDGRFDSSGSRRHVGGIGRRLSVRGP